MGSSLTTTGVATYLTSTLTARSQAIKATYVGDATFKSSSGTMTQIVNLYPSTTNVPTSSLNPSIYGQAVTLATTVTSTAPSPPTGTVVFKNGTTSVGSGTLSTPGVATVTTRTLPAGSLSITSTHNGDSETGKSYVYGLPQTVTQTTSATTMKSSLDPSLSRQTSLSRDVAHDYADGNCNVHGGRHNTRNWRTGTLSGGKATYGTASLSSASHNVSAIYDGTSNIRGSTSGTLVQEVN